MQYYGPVSVFVHINDFFKKPFKGRGNGNGHIAWEAITMNTRPVESERPEKVRATGGGQIS